MNTQGITDKLVRRRARAAIVLAILFLTTQLASLDRGSPDLHNPGPYQLGHLSAWIGWAAILLIVLATGGGFFRSTDVRRMMNDETTLIHRQRACVVGFWSAVLAALGLYVTDLYHPLDTGNALRYVVTVSVGAGLLAFGVLERRALSHG